MSSPVGAFAPAGDPVLPAALLVAQCLPRLEAAARLLPVGCPTGCFLAPTAGSASPVSRLASPAPPLRPEGLRRGSGSSSDRIRFRLVSLVGLRSPLPPLLAASVLGTFPQAPVGVRFPVRGILCSIRFRRSRGIFEITGLSTNKSGYPQKFFVHPPFGCGFCTGDAQAFVELCTAVGVDEVLDPRLNVVRDRADFRRHHHHSIAHVGSRRCAL